MQKVIPTYSGTLRNHSLEVPDCIAECSGIRIFGRRIKSLVFSTDVAIIKNVRSGRMGKKDIIKIDTPMNLDLDVLGYIDANITVNIIRDGVRVEKTHLKLPKKLINVIHCKNPRCITVAESQLDSIFLLSNPERHVYRCAYCDTEKGQGM